MSNAINGIEQPDLVRINESYAKSHRQRFNMAGYAASKLGTVRVGIIGLGNRGPGHLKTLVQIEGVEIKGLCDRSPEKVERALKHLEKLYEDEGTGELDQRRRKPMGVLWGTAEIDPGLNVVPLYEGPNLAGKGPPRGRSDVHYKQTEHP